MNVKWQSGESEYLCKLMVAGSVVLFRSGTMITGPWTYDVFEETHSYHKFSLPWPFCWRYLQQSHSARQRSSQTFLEYLFTDDRHTQHCPFFYRVFHCHSIAKPTLSDRPTSYGLILNHFYGWRLQITLICWVHNCVAGIYVEFKGGEKNVQAAVDLWVGNNSSFLVMVSLEHKIIKGWGLSFTHYITAAGTARRSFEAGVY